jgi:glycyl-tRNA synthetase beta chain
LLPKLQVDAVALSAELVEFLRQRLVSLLEEDGLASDLVQAVAGSTIAAERVVRDPADARLRAELLRALRNSGELAAVEAVVTRAARLAEKGDLSRSVLSAQGVVNPALFEKTSEAAMLAVVEQLEPIAASGASERYRELAELLGASAPTLAAFFDGEQSVMVMSDDPVMRTNRLNLLAVLRNQATVLADFSRLSL